MASSHEDEEWDKSTSEIESEDSDDLHENRPNRWKGPPQSWRTITEEDRLTHNALEKLRNQDLSLHLYNAFRLKQGAASGAADEGSGQEEDVDAETGRPVRNEPWAPSMSWTAWPLPSHLLPPDDFMKTTEDEDEVFTFRRPGDQRPSARLEEIISATTLRFAKERLQRRGFTESARDGDDSTVKAEPLSSGNESQPGGSAGGGDDHEMMDADQDPRGRQTTKKKAPVKTFKPVVSTDDDLSYDLILPSTRRILDKLDDTLSILHNARMTSAQNLQDSEESSPEVDSAGDDHETPPRTPQSRQSSQPASSPSKLPTSPAGNDEAAGSPGNKSNRGRPRKYVQMEGESARDFDIRRAKALKAKVRLPPPPPPPPAPLVDNDGQDEDEAMTTAGESPRKQHRSSPRKRRRRRGRTTAATTSASAASDDDEEGDGREYYWMQKKLDRFRPRGWSDVVGAAALAGFPPGVVARAAQRCADLFGEGMEMHKIGRGAGGVVVTETYRPGGEMLPEADEEEDEEEDVRGAVPRQARSVSRNGSSTAPSSMGSPTSDEEDGGGEGGASPRKEPRKKAAPRRGKGQHFCPFPDCERATAGFDRPFNLKRHMKLVHGDSQPDASEEGEVVVADDMLGGIRRDGFLEPIRVQKGWRAEDTKKRAERRS